MVRSILLILVPTLICVAGEPHFNATDANINIILEALEDSRNEYKVTEMIKVDLYYESHCPDCIADYPQFPPVMKKLGAYINLHTYPYGNAKMYNSSGTITVQCQHGEAECYGNKLHACAIDQLKNVQDYVDFNACMMPLKSDDNAADHCGKQQNVDSRNIKSCAQGAKGQELLVYYGKESEKINYKYVPYVLINGIVKPDDQTLLSAVCGAFKNPPKECGD